MYINGIILLLLPVFLLLLIIAIGIVLYRHPSKLQKKWYQVSYKNRKRVKQAAVILGFCLIAAIGISSITKSDRLTSNIQLSAKEMNFATKEETEKAADQSYNKEQDDQWLKAFYKILTSDDFISANLPGDDGSYDNWKLNIMDQGTGDYEIRINAENVIVEKSYGKDSDEDVDSDEGFDSYDKEGFYNIIQRKDKTFEENYQKLSDSKKQKIINLNWNYKDGLLYATNEDNKICINGAAQYFMKDSKLINSLEKGGYQGIKQWMEDCEKNQAGIKVKAGNKTYLFHNTDQWHKFEKNCVTFLYNYKRFVIRFDLNKVMGSKSHIADLPTTGRELWTVKADHTGASSDEVILRSYNDEDLYAKKHVQIYLKDHKIKQMLIYWNDSDELKGFTKEENIFIKACFEKMGIASDDAAKWLDTFTIKKHSQSGKLGSWNYQQEKSQSQIVSIIGGDTDGNYVNFYKKSKGNN